MASLAVDQPNPSRGDTITFTAVYPKEATRSVTTVQHENPDIRIDFVAGGVLIRTVIANFPDEERNADGTLTGHSGPVTLDDADWPDGPVECNALLYYFYRDKTTHNLTLGSLAYLSFTVAA